MDLLFRLLFFPHIENYDVNYLNYLLVGVQRAQRHTHTPPAESIRNHFSDFAFFLFYILSLGRQSEAHVKWICNTKLNNNFIWMCVGRVGTNGERIKNGKDGATRKCRKREVQLVAGESAAAMRLNTKRTQWPNKPCRRKTTINKLSIGQNH